jgi:hypothetical protein
MQQNPVESGGGGRGLLSPPRAAGASHSHSLPRLGLDVGRAQILKSTLHIDFYVEDILGYSLSRICVSTDFDTAPLHLLGGDHTPTFAAAIAFCCIPKCGREGAAGGHTDLLLVLMKVCMKSNSNRSLLSQN